MARFIACHTVKGISRGLIFALLAFSAATIAQAQVVAELTPEVLAEAVALGAREDVGQYDLSAPTMLVHLDTPFRRVAIASTKARKAGGTLDQSAVPASSTVHITVRPLPLMPVLIKTVLAQVGSEPPVELGEVVRLPIDKVQTAKKRHIEMRGVSGSLPLRVLEPGLKLRIVLEDGTEKVVEPPADKIAALR